MSDVLDVDAQIWQEESEKLAMKLRELRKRAGITTPHLARKCGINRSRISRFESGLQIPFPEEVESILKALKARPVESADVRGLVRGLRHESISHRLIASSPGRPLQGMFAALDESATRIRQLDSNFIPALLQTADYVKSVITSAKWPAEDDVRATAISARVARQQVLFRSGKTFVFVICQRVLRAKHLNAQSMRAQCNHMLSLMSLPNVDVGIFVDDDVLVTCEAQNMTIFDDRLVTTDTILGPLRSTDPVVLDTSTRVFETVSAGSLWGADAISVVQTAADELGEHLMSDVH